MWQTQLCYFDELLQSLPLSATTTPIGQWPSTQRQDPPPAKRLKLAGRSDDG